MAKSLPLPQDVVNEILSRLPVKSLLRFRCVSKTWLRLLTSDAHFIKLHLDRLIKFNNNNPSFVALPRYDQKLYYSEDFDSCDEGIHFELPFEKFPYEFVCGSCNGLLCLSNMVEEYSYKMFIWNPLTNNHITIQCSPAPEDTFQGLTFGFGVHQQSAEYKVIRIDCNTFKSHLSVYTLGTASWRTLEDIPYNVFDLNESSAFVNGALHWFAAKPKRFRWKLVSFDMKYEVFKEIPQPVRIRRRYPCNASVGKLGGLLSVFRTLNDEMEIWVMKEYGVVESWTKQFNIKRLEIPHPSLFLTPVDVTDNGDIIILVDGSKLILYKPKTNSVRILKNFGTQIGGFDTYGGSLVSPSVINRVAHIAETEESRRKRKRVDLGDEKPKFKSG